MYVLGTAGHIDHGKSALIRALTGIDPDRLREEKERGMTIDLGFAWLKLPGGREVGIVDVPGHERFIKNMLAGVGGIDLALLIVAANEGIMPQTREHLAILDLIGVRRGIAVITKKDLVDADMVTLVSMEVAELLAGTVLKGSPVLAVSAVTGEGIPELLSTIDAVLKTTEPRRDLGRPRLPIDRVFTIAGAGTVVTGTLIDGALSVGMEVEIVPAGIKSRLRGLQTHRSAVEKALPGSRVAANIVGVETGQLKRGDVLTRPGWLVPTNMFSARLKLLPYVKSPLKHNAEVSVHTGTAEAMGKVRLLDKDELKPGEESWAQMVLESPVAVIDGDRFIIRTPMETVGGGEVVSARSKRLKRFRAGVIEGLEKRTEGSPEGVILARLESKQPVELAAFLKQLTMPEAEAQAALDSLVKDGKVVVIGSGERRQLYTGTGWQRLADNAVAVVGEYHKRFPARPGMPKAELTSRLKTGVFTNDIISRLSTEGWLVELGLSVRLPEHRVKLTPEQQKKVDAFLEALKEKPYAPPGELIPEGDLLNLLIEERKVVRVAEGVVFSAAAYDEMVQKVTAHLRSKGKITLAEVRDMFATSRKYAQAFLEYLDEKKVTKRVGDERVLGR
ncbi:MAG: selenocysteine-specific translation elongation factor [Chloroflexota bacterium]